MGKIEKVACASCKREWQCMTGCGLSHALLPDVVRAFPEEIGKKVMAETEEEFPVFEFGYRIAICGRCSNVVSVPVLKLEEKNTEYVGPCPVCGEEASLIADIVDAACPRCGKKRLWTEETGGWD